MFGFRSGCGLARAARCLIPVASLLATGCVSVTTAEGHRLRSGDPEFADYVERVFRLQNEAASALAFALESVALDSDRYAALESAETDLLEFCDGLNDIAAARQRGERPGSRRGLAAARAAPQCETAALAATRVLQD